MNIYESAENYLEAILSLRERNGSVRSIDIANELHFSKPSVSVAMKKLRESGYIEMDKDGLISLLPAGEEIARRIYERHQLLTQVFTALGVSPQVAAADACKVEHDLSEETFQKIKAHALGKDGPSQA
nr:metal-dependent transcriptional regulator [uncultured Flavonifractor sp.]